MIEGMLNSSKMHAKVSAHLYNEDDNAREEDGSSTTIYVIKFAKEVTAREKG